MRLAKWLRLLCALLPGVILLAGCPPVGDDDDDDATTPDVTATPEVTPTPDVGDDDSGTPGVETPGPTSAISGMVIAVDRSSGEELDAAEYSGRAGKIAVYALSDPTDLVHPIGKATLAGPGFYTLDVPQDSGQVYVVAVADTDRNNVITTRDLLREALLSPVTMEATPVEDVDIILDLATPGSGDGSGGGPSCGAADFSGNVYYESDRDTDIAVVAFRGDYDGYVYGLTTRENAGEYEVGIYLCITTTSLVGYADVDANGLFEPSDPAGLAENNPYELGPDGATGVDIVIEGVGPVGLPQPIPYITVGGTVSVDDGYTGTLIVLTLKDADANIVYASAALSGPGSFALRAPGGLKDVVVEAVTDSDGDDALGSEGDASDSHGPFDIGYSNIGGIALSLTTPEDPTTGLSGIITYSGTPEPEDNVVIALFQDPTLMAGPVGNMLHYSAEFPISYEFTDLIPGTYYVLAALDVGGDWAGEPGDEDLVGAYTFDGEEFSPVVVTEDAMTSGIDFAIGNYFGLYAW